MNNIPTRLVLEVIRAGGGRWGTRRSTPCGLKIFAGYGDCPVNQFDHMDAASRVREDFIG
jgi:hypothetical protein